MPLDCQHLYCFGEFRLDVVQNVLLRGGKPQALTPKMFALLRVLVENHGQIIGKDDLIKSVWADSFVEEGNLKFTVNQLRKTLGDDARQPLYIETVSRRGYRFIAEVEEIFDAGSESKSETRNGSAAALQGAKSYLPNSKTILASLVVFSILLVGLIVAGSRYVKSRKHESNVPLLSAPFASEMLSTSGKVFHAVISPDGKNVIYTSGINGKESVWLRQLESGNNFETIPPSDDVYFGLALSPDGNILYFVRRPNRAGEPTGIYRVSIFGGVPQKIINETQGSISISPDGAKISYVRCLYGDDEYCSLWIADAADGRNERKLVSRPSPIRIGDNKFAPDGKRIAFAVGQSENLANEFGLVEVNVESGAEREITAERFFDIKSLTWLPENENALLFTARKNDERNFRIRMISLASDKIEMLTNDSEIYSVLSLDKEANRLVSIQSKRESRLLLSNMENPSDSRILVDSSDAVFAPNGRIIFTSEMTGNQEIWSINPDGSGQRQLTNDRADDTAPIVSPDNKTIFFASNRTGAAHIWRMDTADGGNQTQITEKTGGFPLFVSPDGRWIYYLHGLNRRLWRVSASGGEEELVLDKFKYRFAFSPDGLQTAFFDKQGFEKQGDQENIMVVSLSDGKILKTFPVPSDKAQAVDLVWSPDGKNLTYILSDMESKNKTMWLQPLEGGKPKQVAELGDKQIHHFALSPDAKTFILAQGDWRHDAILLKGLK